MSAAAAAPAAAVNAAVVKINGLGRRQQRVLALRDGAWLNVRTRGSGSSSTSAPANAADAAAARALLALLAPTDDGDTAGDRLVPPPSLPPLLLPRLTDGDHELSKALRYEDVAAAYADADTDAPSASDGDGAAAPPPVLTIGMRRTHDFAFATPLAPLLALLLRRRVAELRDARRSPASSAAAVVGSGAGAGRPMAAAAASMKAAATAAAAGGGGKDAGGARTGPSRAPTAAAAAAAAATASVIADWDGSAAAASVGAGRGRARTASMVPLAGDGGSGGSGLAAPAATPSELLASLTPADRVALVVHALLCDSSRAAEGRARSKWVTQELPRLLADSLKQLGSAGGSSAGDGGGGSSPAGSAAASGGSSSKQARPPPARSAAASLAVGTSAAMSSSSSSAARSGVALRFGGRPKSTGDVSGARSGGAPPLSPHRSGGGTGPVRRPQLSTSAGASAGAGGAGGSSGSGGNAGGSIDIELTSLPARTRTVEMQDASSSPPAGGGNADGKRATPLLMAMAGDAVSPGGRSGAAAGSSQPPALSLGAGSSSGYSGGLDAFPQSSPPALSGGSTPTAVAASSSSSSSTAKVPGLLKRLRSSLGLVAAPSASTPTPTGSPPAARAADAFSAAPAPAQQPSDVLPHYVVSLAHQPGGGPPLGSSMETLPFPPHEALHYSQQQHHPHAGLSSSSAFSTPATSTSSASSDVAALRAALTGQAPPSSPPHRREREVLTLTASLPPAAAAEGDAPLPVTSTGSLGELLMAEAAGSSGSGSPPAALKMSSSPPTDAAALGADYGGSPLSGGGNGSGGFPPSPLAAPPSPVAAAASLLPSLPLTRSLRRLAVGLHDYMLLKRSGALARAAALPTASSTPSHAAASMSAEALSPLVMGAILDGFFAYPPVAAAYGRLMERATAALARPLPAASPAAASAAGASPVAAFNARLAAIASWSPSQCGLPPRLLARGAAHLEDDSWHAACVLLRACDPAAAPNNADDAVLGSGTLSPSSSFALAATPLERLSAFIAAADATVAAASVGLTGAGSGRLTADDLISSFVLLLARAQPRAPLRLLAELQLAVALGGGGISLLESAGGSGGVADRIAGGAAGAGGGSKSPTEGPTPGDGGGSGGGTGGSGGIGGRAAYFVTAFEAALEFVWATTAGGGTPTNATNGGGGRF